MGAQVVYGIVGLKTHAKLLLVTRREAGARGPVLRRYAHLSTGNYNPRTARLYTDIGVLTADAELTADADLVFQQLASLTRGARRPNSCCWRRTALHRQMLAEIERCAEAARGGQAARIVVKINALTDEPLMNALAAASQAGVDIDLIVRGACMLPPGVPGVTDRIRVRSVVGRFLEHSRILYFRWGPAEDNEDPLPVQCRLDDAQHDAPHRSGVAGARRGAAPARDRMKPWCPTCTTRSTPGSSSPMAAMCASAI